MCVCVYIMQAKKDLSFGDCVLSEIPYVALLNKEHLYTHCSYCFKKSSTILPLGCRHIDNNLYFHHLVVLSVPMLVTVQ